MLKGPFSFSEKGASRSGAKPYFSSLFALQIGFWFSSGENLPCYGLFKTILWENSRSPVRIKESSLRVSRWVSRITGYILGYKE
jgi:hypothetical protein